MKLKISDLTSVKITNILMNQFINVVDNKTSDRITSKFWNEVEFHINNIISLQIKNEIKNK